MQRQGSHQEWAQLRMAGRPLLTGIALGSTPLLWVACRTSPCLVHVFQDGELQSVWRFRSDPSFLLLGEASAEVLPVGDSGCKKIAASLLVITADGGVWLVSIPSKSSFSSEQEGARHPKNNLGGHGNLGSDDAKHVEKSGDSSTEWQLFEDNDVYEERGNSAAAGFSTPKLPDDPGTIAETNQSGLKALSSLLWADLWVSSSESKNTSGLVTEEALVGVVPFASFAAFTTSSSVIVVTQSGSPILLRPGFPHQVENVHRPMIATATCLLLASNAGSGSGVEGGLRSTVLSKDLFASVAGGGKNVLPSYLLFVGDDRGKVQVYALPDLTLVVLSSTLLCDLEEPIVDVLSVPLGCRDGRNKGSELLLIVGKGGTVLVMSSAEEALGGSPFVPCNSRKLGHGIHLPRTDVGFHQWRIKAPVTSVCMLGAQHFCYNAGSEVFVAEIFEVSSGSAGLMQSQSSGKQLRHSLLHKTVPVADRVCAVAGNGASAARVYSGRPLVVLTTRGRLLSVQVLDEVASGAVVNHRANIKSSCSWAVSQSRVRETVKDLLQTVADIATQTDAVRIHISSMNMAIHELAGSLHLAYELTKQTTTEQPIFVATATHGSKLKEQALNRAGKGICCALQVYQPPSSAVLPDQLCFAASSSLGKTMDAHLVCKPIPTTKVSVCLENFSNYPLSPYWTLILKLESVTPSSRPVAMFLSTTINNSLGLQVGAAFSHDFNVQLPGTYMSPVIVSIFLCHIHDYHEKLLSDPSREGTGTTPGLKSRIPSALDAGDGTRVRKEEDPHAKFAVEGELGKKVIHDTTNPIPGAVCFLLCRYRIDILSLLKPPPVGTLWSRVRKHKLEATGVGRDPDDVYSVSDLSGSFSLEGFEKPTVPELWETLHLEHLFHQSAMSKSDHQITLLSPDQEMVTISIQNTVLTDNGNRPASLFFQATSPWLCCLVREALRSRMSMFKREKNCRNPDTSDEKGRKRLKMHGGKLYGELPFDTEEVASDPKLHSIRKIRSMVETLGHRAQVVMAKWKRILSEDTPETAEMVAPVMAHTCELVKDLVRTYNLHRSQQNLH